MNKLSPANTKHVENNASLYYMASSETMSHTLSATLHNVTWLWPYIRCVPAGKLLNITCLSCASLTYSKTYRYFTRLNISQAFSLTNAYGRHHFIQIPCQHFFLGASIYNHIYIYLIGGFEHFYFSPFSWE